MANAQDFSRDQLARLGGLIREQRRAAQLTLRQLAELTNVSNPYLSQIERGLHEPSVRVLKAIAAALDLSADVLLAEAGLLERVGSAARPRPAQSPTAHGEGAASPTGENAVEAAIGADPWLGADQKAALVQVYRGFVTAAQATRPPAPGPGR